MQLNKVGGFTMQNLGQSKSVVSDFMKKKKQQDGSSFEEGMLKLLRTLPKVRRWRDVRRVAHTAAVQARGRYLGGVVDPVDAVCPLERCARARSSRSCLFASC